MKGNKMLRKDNPITQAINDMYKPIEPVVWIVNFENGTSLSSMSFPTGFLAISMKDREKIRALRFKIGNYTYNISRKTTDSHNNSIITKGFFYHIKEGRATLFGKYQTHIPFFAERFGFCYNSWGDSEAIRIDHSGYLREVAKRVTQIEQEIEKHGWEKAGAQVDKITNQRIDYEIQINRYQENIAGALPGRMITSPNGKPSGVCFNMLGMKLFKQGIVDNLSKYQIPCLAVNLDLFGDLTKLDELGTPPRITESSKETSHGSPSQS